MIHGSCLCGAVQYAIDHDLTSMSHCHCSMCRKSQGTNFATFAGAPASKVSWHSGVHLIRHYRSAVHTERCFCEQCGSTVYVRHLDGDSLYFPVGNLTGDFGRRPDRHIFVDSKAPWYAITDDLAQHSLYSTDDGPPAVKQAQRCAQTEGVHGGSCLCGKVAFEYTGDPVRMWNCHCSRCRLARGTAHATNLFVPAAAFRWVRGEELVYIYKVPEADRFAQAFCSECGSVMARHNPQSPFTVIPVGTMDDDPGLRPMGHIFVDSKSTWFPITDNIPQHSEGPPA